MCAKLDQIPFPKFGYSLKNIRNLKGIFSDFNNIFLWQKLEDINKKKLISKISVDSNFTHAWLCVFHFSHRLLCWIKSRVRDFLWKLLSFHSEMVSAQFLWGGALLRGEPTTICKKFKSLKIWERPLFDIRDYAFSGLKYETWTDKHSFNVQYFYGQLWNFMHIESCSFLDRDLMHEHMSVSMQ